MPMTKTQLLAWIDKQNAVFCDKKEYLTDLDAAIGDADHGINMNRGFAKVMEKLPTVADKDLPTILKTVGMTLMSSVGGASGPLYGTFWMKGAMALDGKTEMTTADFKAFLEAAVGGIVQRGRPELGDKTMYDLWGPVLAAVKAAEDATPLAEVVAAALPVAEAALAATIPLQARKGRASYLGERSIGHPDPGATSSLFMLQTLREALG
ncbi:dihydroxyacetone kinase subunit DhaL [Solidesulfovibrio magneticus]|uniref:PTS-dependent dihydroxyacetone kinase ADP-binding subunit dhaL n=1 Tax=Solidesulfovibrio magneticus (strain ATCC 700980 / DSM 13731 / RS-1) TaxID=573370 RepID=C4XLB2_SOLM1|nr:dihydroxyacetone kinase subunit DhaL [Solidesulfovibrio magneticus]BAH77051.1 PTS-dependent dihydroxyacetone kinase ADP-binding subunit dhaL [Solidesulfovibrio magneticus RS-1]